MKIQETARGTIIDIFVKPKSKKFQVNFEDDHLVVYCREAPVKGRVNRELIKELSRLFKRRVEIVYGFNSRQKRVLIADTSIDKINEILSTCR